jgi:hypothetical protein
VQMSPKVIAGIIAFCVAMTGLFVSNMFVTMMIGEINRKRSPGNLVSYFGFTALKMQRIYDEYRRLYPDGKFHRYSSIAFGIAVIGLATIGALFAFTALRAAGTL